MKRILFALAVMAPGIVGAQNPLDDPAAILMEGTAELVSETNCLLFNSTLDTIDTNSQGLISLFQGLSIGIAASKAEKDGSNLVDQSLAVQTLIILKCRISPERLLLDVMQEVSDID